MYNVTFFTSYKDVIYTLKKVNKERITIQNGESPYVLLGKLLRFIPSSQNLIIEDIHWINSDYIGKIVTDRRDHVTTDCNNHRTKRILLHSY